MEQSLTVLPSKAIAPMPVSAQYADQSGLSAVAKLKPTNLVLIQNTTRDFRGARPGQIVDDLTGRIYDKVTLVILKVMKQRVLFPPGADLNSKPLCRSNDCILPSPFIEHPQATHCGACVQSKWIGGKPCGCKVKLKMLVIMKETGLPRWISFGGKSYSPAQWLIDNIAQDIYVKAHQTPPVNLKMHDYFFEVSLDAEKGSYNYFVARFKNVTQVANPDEFGPLFEQFVLAAQAVTDEEEVVQTATTSEAKVDVAVDEIVHQAEFVSV